MVGDVRILHATVQLSTSGEIVLSLTRKLREGILYHSRGLDHIHRLDMYLSELLYMQVIQTFARLAINLVTDCWLPGYPGSREFSTQKKQEVCQCLPSYSYISSIIFVKSLSLTGFVRNISHPLPNASWYAASEPKAVSAMIVAGASECFFS